MRIRFSLVLCLIALAPMGLRAAPVTEHLEDVAGRLAVLDADTTLVRRQRKAVARALAELGRDSDSAGDDLLLIRRVAKRLARPFRDDAALVVMIGTAVTALRGEVEAERAVLVDLLGRSGESKARSRAQRKLRAAERLLGRADEASTSVQRARLLRKAWARIGKGLRALDGVAIPDPQPTTPAAGPLGAPTFKSGPIQVTADGAYVWLVNTDNDSVSRITTADSSVTEFLLPAGTRHDPRGLSVTTDGSEVWVACHDSDRVCVLAGGDGRVLASIDLPWGSGPHSLAISPDQEHVLVTCFRSASVAAIDRASRTVDKIVAPLHQSPLSVTWTADGGTAWVTHVFAEEHPGITCIDVSGDEPRATAEVTAFATGPRQSARLAAPYDIAEGGYLTFRGHTAQIPAAGGRNEIWLPTQYSNIHEDRFSADSTIQATLRHLDLDTQVVLSSNADKVILSAVHVHETSGNPEAYVGPGWNASVAGPIDIAFTADGATCYVVCEQSNEVIVVPTSTPAVRPQGAPPLTEIRVGNRPMGIAVSPTTGAAYVLNRYARDVSVLDMDDLREHSRIPVTPRTGEPFTPDELLGARHFHTSADPRISSNEKVACASCHVDGEHDGRTWGFHTLPGRHGPRQTPTLRGLDRTIGERDPATGFGQLHRSGDRDEVQDFEHTFRGPSMQGRGFIPGAVNPELGAPNAGRSPDLDALATYVLGLRAVARSPFRQGDGTLSEAAVRGATFFVGEDPQGHPSDAGCVRCHVPETGFVDQRFHDVGAHRPSSERELNDSGNPLRQGHLWEVNTPTLIGVWGTPGYDGVSTWAANLLDFVEDLQGRSNHGTPAGLSGRQLLDFVEFLSSVDGDLTGAQVRSARDTSPPRIERVAPTSLTRIDVWFDETVDRTTAQDPANWSIRRGGQAVPVTAATFDPQNGDRVTLTTALSPGCDSPITYTLSASGIRDVADRASGGTANTLDAADPRNTVAFDLSDRLTITLGASGYENLTVPVHDAGMAGANLATWSHDRVRLFGINGGSQVQGFVRFDWRDAFVQATGVSDSAGLVDAALRLRGERGRAQEIEVRRCLLPWSDSPGFKDWNTSATGAPTWRDHAHPDGRWNQAGARKRTAGVNGRAPADYDGSDDLAFDPDAIARFEAVNETMEFGGAAVADAFRFWFDHPQVDYGYAMQLRSGSRQSAEFHAWEGQLRQQGPVLVLTYVLPGCE